MDRFEYNERRAKLMIPYRISINSARYCHWLNEMIEITNATGIEIRVKGGLLEERILDPGENIKIEVKTETIFQFCYGFFGPITYKTVDPGTYMALHIWY